MVTGMVTGMAINKTIVLCISAGSLLASVGSVSLAGDWTISPRVSVTETYTDNVRLASEGEEVPELITNVSPGISIRGAGARLSVNFDYVYELLYYGRHTTATETFHTLQGNANAELIKSLFYVDARSTISQQNVDDGITAADNLNATGNRDAVITTSISPYVNYSLGTYANAVARYTYDTVSSGGT